MRASREWAETRQPLERRDKAGPMVRPLASGLFSAALAVFVVQATGCGTDAVGIDECRDIEEARCEAGQYCGLVEDVDACKRFYRDQCLHGMASGERPGKVQVTECVKVIREAGDCAKKGVTDLTNCTNIPGGETNLTLVCDVIKEPESVKDCDFLYKPVVVPDAAADAAPETSLPPAAEAGADVGASET